MLNTPFYNASIRKYAASFGKLFSNISIIRGQELKKVPIAFESRQQWLQRLNQRNTIDDSNAEVKMTLPRMSFNISGFSYDTERATSKFTSSYHNTNNVTKRQFRSVPYNIDFSLNIVSNSITDTLQIIEQIIPYFNPEYHLNIKDNPLTEESSALPLTLNSSSFVSDVEGFVGQRRYTFAELQFTLQGNFYFGSETGHLIEYVDVNLYSMDENEEINEYLAKLEIDAQDINFETTFSDNTNISADNIYNIIETITEYQVNE
jgi:hypothetical protein